MLALALGGCGGEPDEPALRVAGSASDGLVFVTNFARPSADLARARIADGAIVALTATEDREERWPYWSATAEQLVFQARPTANENSLYDLLLRRPGETERVLTRTPRRDERWPAWSPDGRWLVYSFWGGQPASGVALFDVATDTRRVIARASRDDAFFRANFAPDSRRLVAQRRGPDGGSNLWLLGTDRPPRPLTRDPGSIDLKAWWSADGEWIVYSRRRRDAQPRDLARIPADGGEPQPITRTPDIDEHSARPSPVGPQIVFVSDATGSSEIFLSETADGEARNLTRTPDLDEYAPRWSPDGRRIVLTVAAAGEGAAGGRSTGLRVRVIDRTGAVLFEAPGMMPDWMPPWP